MVVARGGAWRGGEVSEGSHKVQTLGIADLKAAKEELKGSHRKKTFFITMLWRPMSW